MGRENTLGHAKVWVPPALDGVLGMGMPLGYGVTQGCSSLWGAACPPAPPQNTAAALHPSCPAGSCARLAPGGQAPGAGPAGFSPSLSHCGMFSAAGPSSPS